MRVEDLDTPALTIDLDILSRNIHDLAESCRRHKIALRVHTKTHKIPEIAHLQLQAGAIGIVCQKLGEAEVMVDAGITDILIPYNIVGARKVERLVRLRKRATIAVALDSETTARGISNLAGEPEIPVLIELDTGGNRCGVQSPEAALELARKVVQLRGLRFQGIMTYPSRPQAEPFLTRTRTLLEDAGIRSACCQRRRDRKRGRLQTDWLHRNPNRFLRLRGDAPYQSLGQPSEPDHLRRTHDRDRCERAHPRTNYRGWRPENLRELSPHPLRSHRGTPGCQNKRHVGRTRPY